MLIWNAFHESEDITHNLQRELEEELYRPKPDLIDLQHRLRGGRVNVLNDCVGNPYLHLKDTNSYVYVRDISKIVADLPLRNEFSLELETRRRGIELLRTFKNLTASAAGQSSYLESTLNLFRRCRYRLTDEENRGYDLFLANDPIVMEVPENRRFYMQNGMVKIDPIDWPKKPQKYVLSDRIRSLRKEAQRSAKQRFRTEVYASNRFNDIEEDDLLG